MSKRLLSHANRHHTISLIPALLGLCLAAHADADDATPEHARLAAALRQLDSIERLVAQQAAHEPDARARYHFDYGRLATDLERVRGGISDYLTPSRAQPRDPAELLGDYRQPAAELDAQEEP